MSEIDYQSLATHVLSLYHVTFPGTETIPVSVIFTDDLNRTHAEIRPDRRDELLTNNRQSDFNGRMVVPLLVEDSIYVLLNETKFYEYIQDGSMTWVGTLAHEYTHALDFYQMARLEGLDSYAPLEETDKYILFQQWTEYHARRCGYRLLRRYFEVMGQMPNVDEQLQYIINIEAPRHTEWFYRDYQRGTGSERLYLTMQYLGRYSVWMDLFPDVFTEDKVLEYCPGTYWMVDILSFLRGHETLESVYDNFVEFQDVLSENWTF